MKRITDKEALEIYTNIHTIISGLDDKVYGLYNGVTIDKELCLDIILKFGTNTQKLVLTYINGILAGTNPCNINQNMYEYLVVVVANQLQIKEDWVKYR